MKAKNVIRKALAYVFVLKALCAGKNHDKAEAVAGCAGEHKNIDSEKTLYVFRMQRSESEMIVQRIEGMAYEVCAFICAKGCAEVTKSHISL